MKLRILFPHIKTIRVTFILFLQRQLEFFLDSYCVQRKNHIHNQILRVNAEGIKQQKHAHFYFLE
jgi:hypothetical protein